MMVLVYGLFGLVTFSCIFIGIYFLYINVNSVMNKLAFLFSASLSCWCFGKVNSLGASSYSDSLIWRRFGAIGVGTGFSFLLHYILILTENEAWLKKKGSRFAIYLPAVIAVYIVSISESITNQIYHLKKESIGWVRMPTFNLWLLFVYVYSISVMVIVLCLIYKWKKKCTRMNKKKQADYILIAYSITLVMGISYEIVHAFYSNSIIQELSPILLILPMGSFFHAIKKHNFMKETIEHDNRIFIKQFRTKITLYLSVTFLGSGIGYLILQYIHNNYIVSRQDISYALMIFIFGAGIYFGRRFCTNARSKVILYSILLSACIPAITLHFVKYAAITVWVVPFIIIIAALLFRNSTIVTMVSTSMILTQLYIWIKVPYCVVVVDHNDYVGRMVLMGIAILFISYINNIYNLRLNQLSDKIKTQDLLFHISSKVISINSNNVDEKMVEVLNLVRKYVDADRVHICSRASKEDKENPEYYYLCSDVEKIEGKILKDASITQFPWWKKQVEETGVVQIFDVSKLPEEAKPEKEFLLNQNVMAMLAVPLMGGNEKIGFLRIDSVDNPKIWDDEFIKLLMIIGNILGEANIKVSSENKITHMAYYDRLTSIPNRQLFGELINEEVHQSEKVKNLFGIIFLDLDSFKSVNDTMGHHFGDKMLVMIADKLKRCLRKTDVVCRFGGDEFLIMVKDVASKEDIEVVITKIMKQFEEHLFIEEHEFNITASAGIALFPMDGRDEHTLIKNADIAMYNAKSNGKNQYLFCSEEMKKEMEQTMIITKYLYHALEKEEFNIVYQPQISIESGKVVAVEALLRWDNPSLGIILPAKFISIAEHKGMINSIGEWVLLEACKQNKLWHEMGLPPVRVAINVSVNQLLNLDFVSKVSEVLQQTGLEPTYLELEVTENIAIQESDVIVNVLSKLKALGVSLAIDDFGIEYSSLSRIKILPVDRLKIDMHFMRGILSSEKDRAIVDTIIKLAKDLSLTVIAEGVEVEEQLDFLKQKNCDEVQGYYFYKPLSKEEMEECLRNHI